MVFTLELKHFTLELMHFTLELWYFTLELMYFTLELVYFTLELVYFTSARRLLPRSTGGRALPISPFSSPRELLSAYPSWPALLLPQHFDWESSRVAQVSPANLELRILAAWLGYLGLGT